MPIPSTPLSPPPAPTAIAETVDTSPSPVPPDAIHALAVVPPTAPPPPPDAALAVAPPASEVPLPEDYLASTEALLQSLAEEEVQDEPQPSAEKANGGLLSPLGLGSLLLLLLSSLSLGYALLNPDRVPFLAPQWQGGEAPTPSPPVSSPGTLPNVPNLATDEFVDLKLDTLGTLAVPSPSPTVAPSASPFPSASPSSSASPAPDPGGNPAAANPTTPIETIPLRVVQPPTRSQSVAPVQAPIAPRSQPAPPPRSATTAPTSTLPSLPVPGTTAPTPTRVPVVTPTAPTATSSRSTADQTARSTGGDAGRSQPNPSPDTYNVVTEYQGNASLAELQQVAPGAYLRNYSDGIRVQLGTFDDRASAQEMVNQLNQQGIPARVQAE